MTQEITKNISENIPEDLQEKVFVNGDLGKLTPNERLNYYSRLCESLNLNPITRPFEYITLQGRMTLYARKDATEQLRKINKISIEKMDEKILNDIYKVQVTVCDSSGRKDVATGAVNIGGLKGDALANAYMKAETKAKRRATLSICGLGILDESELETIQEIKTKNNNFINEEKKQIFLENVDWIQEIIKTKNLDELKYVFTNAYRYAEESENNELKNDLIKIKNEKKEKLELEG